ncbi:SAC3/GANP/Nin1/mts3/eIF-3 p25 family-domain-containing protein [Phakopsora pachyrhizi]|uniref:SAC3/GANP/Nin1/mts3/eIF-3 p25 family-domain-containing protein n=1 Tax=Phakopsora pachyrhizi TaxID=170000 RepID=A0AAV0BIC0_PHAPC|nr:SAC3/GANP/Nin1/mts3/eIF-3 p25 family-domain-containing protein [Phakopsora pachyrhizi]CAH7685831.1 SAC3/GANP/Nin1/mts3/eIF-3 p25 family-domain-containing protein [Phakopsora pachyrhizi]
MSATQSSWPPSLKEFVNQTFGKCNDSNRPAVEAELKALIFDAFKNGRLWSINWPEVQLQTLLPINKRKQNPLTFTATSQVVNVEEEADRRQKRLRRFDNIPNTTSAVNHLHIHEEEGGAISSFPQVSFDYQKNIPDWDRHTIVGCSQRLEKPYLRLTSEPNPADVRPLEVCKETLKHLKNKWKNEGNYNWICDQFKSLRQDLTVQRIKNEFTVSVYEAHARIALEKADLGEFNQCASQLRQLYKQGLKGKQDEFLAYHILYLIYSRNHSELNEVLPNITDSQRQVPCVKHALDVRFAVSTGNYRRFFNLFCVAPMMAGYLMDRFTERERIRALAIMARAFRPLPIPHLTSQLAFNSDGECREFLKRHDALYYSDQQSYMWDTKAAKEALHQASLKTRKVDIKGQI